MLLKNRHSVVVEAMKTVFLPTYACFYLDHKMYLETIWSGKAVNGIPGLGRTINLLLLLVRAEHISRLSSRNDGYRSTMTKCFPLINNSRRVANPLLHTFTGLNNETHIAREIRL